MTLLQGFGNVGAWAAELINLQGGKVVAISDRSGAIVSESGLDVMALRRHMRASPPFGGHLTSFPGGKPKPLKRFSRNVDLSTLVSKLSLGGCSIPSVPPSSGQRL